MTELVYSENSSSPSTNGNGDHDTIATVSSSSPFTSIGSVVESGGTLSSFLPLSTASTITSSKTNIPTSNAVAAAAALLANPSLSSFRQLAELWHPHVYNSATKRPTPFSIEDILKENNRENNIASNRPQLYGSGFQNIFNHLNMQNIPYGLNESNNTSGGFLPELTSALAQHMVASSVHLQQGLNQTDSSEENDKSSLSPDTRDSSGSLPPLPPLIPATKASVQDNTNDCDQPLNLTTKKHDGIENGERPFDISSIVKSDVNDRIRCIKRKKDNSGSSILSQNANISINSDQFLNEEEEDDRKRKKVRTTFTGRQIFELEKMFENKKYLSSSERSEMARLLNVTEQQVKIWFQNRRTKWKKQENISNAEAAELMKAKSIKSPDRQGTIPVSNFIPSLTNNSMTNGHITNTNGSILGRETCTSPVSSINTIQSSISSGALIQSLTPKDAPSPFQATENNSIHENMSPSSTSTSSPFIRSSSSNSNSSLTLAANGSNGSVHHAMSDIINPIDKIPAEETKETDPSVSMKYSLSPSRVKMDNKEENEEVSKEKLNIDKFFVKSTNNDFHSKNTEDKAIDLNENGLNNGNESNNEELENEDSYSCEKPSNE